VNRRTGANLAASVRQRLLNKARETGRPFNEILQHFAMERFLYRLAMSPHVDKFVLKGALMFTAWRAPISRPTMDIDLLGFATNNIDTLGEMTKAICRQVVEPDGLTFEPESMEGEHIVEEAEYEGVRVRFRGSLGTARITMQLDIGSVMSLSHNPSWSNTQPSCRYRPHGYEATARKAPSLKSLRQWSSSVCSTAG
jgi:hypothetical protein